MKLVLFDGHQPGLLKGANVIDVSDITGSVSGRNGQEIANNALNRIQQFQASAAAKQ